MIPKPTRRRPICRTPPARGLEGQCEDVERLSHAAKSPEGSRLLTQLQLGTRRRVDYSLLRYGLEPHAFPSVVILIWAFLFSPAWFPSRYPFYRMALYTVFFRISPHDTLGMSSFGKGTGA
ncbi:uncharacterized protein BDW43DRAFT_130941 [Aspergillus alliaceus]|uniref:uncharacterized protein n=1 Tax=Petromyces alliaceus TaxID=209559 RepID=UPI0012A4C487|nr:uncharacterized protein BDW43DRAFT_130941 [Aspergillus alliaceus]KAB8231972.1 hypothetical protein BDW43DRAFT_130941 [Aspergillus alliaceus]